MKFKPLALVAALFFATGANAELATEANSINFRKTSGAEQNLADVKDAKFQDARFKSTNTAARSANPNSSQKATLIDEAKNFYRVGRAAVSQRTALTGATLQSYTSLA